MPFPSPEDQTYVSLSPALAGRFFTTEPPGKLKLIIPAAGGLVAKLCPTLLQPHGPMDCSPPGSTFYGIFHARILEWVAISFSRDLSDPGIKLACLISPALAGGFFATSATWEAPLLNMHACLVASVCPTLYDPIDCSPPDSSVLGILQARTLEWVFMLSSKGSS